MEKQPETFREYFALQLRKLKRWMKPAQHDPFLLKAVKMLGKVVVVMIMVVVSPVLILGLTLAFIGAF
jgi:hypothetical protein